MDITQALKDTENSLRDFIAVVLRARFGENWLTNCGVTPQRIEKWRERKLAEEQRQESGVVEERLIYYADFYDLRSILKKQWSGDFSAAFGDWKTMDVWLAELEKLRDPDAHRRELLPHQKHLLLGIAGEIRTRLIRYRSKQETSEDYYPRIESARDSLGNIYTYGNPVNFFTKTRLRAGDTIDFVITASDPLGEPLQYAIFKGSSTVWQDGNNISLRINDEDVQNQFNVFLAIRSKRQYHAHKLYDEIVIFIYDVLPPK